MNRDDFHVSIDDDKEHMDLNDRYENAKRNCHVKDNSWGLAHHDLATASLGNILSTECEKASDIITSVTEKLIKKLFSAEVSYLRMPYATMRINRGCLAWDSIILY